MFLGGGFLFRKPTFIAKPTDQPTERMKIRKRRRGTTKIHDKFNKIYANALPIVIYMLIKKMVDIDKSNKIKVKAKKKTDTSSYIYTIE